MTTPKLLADFSGLDAFRAPRLEYTQPNGFRNGGRILAVYEDVVDFVPDGGAYRELTFPRGDVRFVANMATESNPADFR